MSAPDTVARNISVNGEEISSAAIAAETQNHNAPKNRPGDAWRTAARALVIRALLLQEAERLGLSPDPQLLESDKRETDEEALIRAVLDIELDPEDVSEADCKLVYERQREVFFSPNLFQPAHILFAAKPEDSAAREIAKTNAKAFIQAIQKAPKTFAAIAKENSDCPSKETGGVLGQVGSGETVPEFEIVLNQLEPGQLHPEPVETRFGIHIIRMDEKAEGEALPFDAVKPQIRERLEQIAWARAAKVMTQKLVENADIQGIDISEPSEKLH
ncbi:MAG: peptidylprolyl isomerase [Devosiaceae bacterium]|nr:peptidylprolyl isomerase [Devosiaceae bacterium]